MREFEWNPNKATLNIEKHGVSFQEVAILFNDQLSVTFPDPKHFIGESRYVIIGISRYGQLLIVAHTDRAEKKYESSAPEKLPARSRGFMKKDIEQEMEDELLAEYDFAQMEGGVRGKYIERYRAGTNLVLLDLNIARAFPNDAAP